MKQMELQWKRVAVLGCGESGAAASRLAMAQGACVSIFDTGASVGMEKRAAELTAEGVACHLGGDALEAAAAFAQGCDLAVLSPGIEPTSELPRIFTDAQTLLVGEVEFAWRVADEPVVAITGTNGKTTTTSLVATLLNAVGLKSVPCGNFGRPFCDVVMQEEDITVHTVEVSSFQLEGITSFRPRVAVWLNFAPDHLDRYSGIDEYLAAKLRIFDYQQGEDLVVMNAREPVPTGRGRVVTFSSKPDEFPADYEFREGLIWRGGERIYDFSTGLLRGAHNAENVMAALAVVHEFGAADSDLVPALKQYRAPRHRCELVAIVDGREFLNDSKSTNLHSLSSALASLGRRVVLIAGGKDKGLDYGPLTPLIAAHASAVVTIGEIGGALHQLWRDITVCETAVTVQEATEKALWLSRPGETVLFSPGTSSFDMFSGYEERGAVFCDAVLQLFSKQTVKSINHLKP